MLPTPAQWAAQLKEIVKRQDWERYYELTVYVDQGFADRRDWDGLEGFYSEALSAAAPEIAAQARIDGTQPLQDGLVELLRTGVQRAAADATIEGLYCEFYYDGHPETGVIELFPCRTYSEESDGWAAEFVGNEVVTGPSAFEYLSFDNEIDLDPLPDAVGRRYVRAHLLGAFGRAVDRVDGIRWPVGFCDHDDRMIRIRPR